MALSEKQKPRILLIELPNFKDSINKWLLEPQAEAAGKKIDAIKFDLNDAEMRFLLGKYEEALLIYEKALGDIAESGLTPNFDAIFSSFIKEMANYALRLLQNEKIEEALGILNRCELLTRPEKFGAHPLLRTLIYNYMGCFQKRKKQFMKALNFFNKALGIIEASDLKEYRGLTYVNLSSLYSQLDYHDDALEYAKSAVKFSREEFEIAVFHAGENAEMNKKSKAFIELSTTLAIAYHDLGFEEEHCGRMEEALKSYKKGLEIAKDNLGGASSLFKKFKADFDSFNERKKQALVSTQDLTAARSSYTTGGERKMSPFSSNSQKYQPGTFFSNRPGTASELSKKLAAQNFQKTQQIYFQTNPKKNRPQSHSILRDSVLRNSCLVEGTREKLKLTASTSQDPFYPQETQRAQTAKAKKTHFQEELEKRLLPQRPGTGREKKGWAQKEASDIFSNSALIRHGIIEDFDEKNYLEDIKVLSWESEEAEELEKLSNEDEESRSKRELGRKLREIKKNAGGKEDWESPQKRVQSARTADLLEADLRNISSTLLSKKEDLRRIEESIVKVKGNRKLPVVFNKRENCYVLWHRKEQMIMNVNSRFLDREFPREGELSVYFFLKEKVMVLSLNVTGLAIGVIEKRIYLESLFPSEIQMKRRMGGDDLNRQLVLLDDMLDIIVPLIKLLDDRKIVLEPFLRKDKLIYNFQLPLDPEAKFKIIWDVTGYVVKPWSVGDLVFPYRYGYISEEDIFRNFEKVEEFLRKIIFRRRVAEFCEKEVILSRKEPLTDVLTLWIKVWKKPKWERFIAQFVCIAKLRERFDIQFQKELSLPDEVSAKIRRGQTPLIFFRVDLKEKTIGFTKFALEHGVLQKFSQSMDKKLRDNNQACLAAGMALIKRRFVKQKWRNVENTWITLLLDKNLQGMLEKLRAMVWKNNLSILNILDKHKVDVGSVHNYEAFKKILKDIDSALEDNQMTVLFKCFDKNFKNSVFGKHFIEHFIKLDDWRNHKVTRLLKKLKRTVEQKKVSVLNVCLRNKVNFVKPVNYKQYEKVFKALRPKMTRDDLDLFFNEFKQKELTIIIREPFTRINIFLRNRVELIADLRQIIKANCISLYHLIIKNFGSKPVLVTGTIDLEQFKTVLLNIDSNLRADELEYLFNGYVRDRDEAFLYIADIIEDLQSPETDETKLMIAVKRKLLQERISFLELLVKQKLFDHSSLSYEEFEQLFKSIDSTLLKEDLILAYRSLRSDRKDFNSAVSMEALKTLLHGKAQEEIKATFDRFLEKIKDAKVSVPEVVQGLNMSFSEEHLSYKSFAEFARAIDATLRAETVHLIFCHILDAYCSPELRARFEKIPMAVFMSIFIGDLNRFTEDILNRLKSRMVRYKVSIMELFLQLRIMTTGLLDLERFQEIISRIDFSIRKEEVALLFRWYSEKDYHKIYAEKFIRDVNFCENEVNEFLKELKQKIARSNVSVLEHLLVCGVRNFKQETITLDKFADFVKLIDNCCRKEQIILLFERFQPDYDRKISVKEVISELQDNATELDELIEDLRRLIKENEISLLELLLKLRIEFRESINFEQFFTLMKTLSNSLRREQILLIFLKLDYDEDSMIDIRSFISLFNQFPNEIGDLMRELKNRINSNSISILRILRLLKLEFEGHINFEMFKRIMKRIDITLRREQVLLIFKDMEDSSTGQVSLKKIIDAFVREVVWDEVEDLIIEIKQENKENNISILEILAKLEYNLHRHFELSYEEFERILKVMNRNLKKEDAYLLFQKIDSERTNSVSSSKFYDLFDVNLQEAFSCFDAILERLRLNKVSVLEIMESKNMEIFEGDLDFRDCAEVFKQIDNGLRIEQIYIIYNQVFNLYPPRDKISVKSFLDHMGQNHYEIEKIIMELRETLQFCSLDMIKILIMFEIPLLGMINAHEFAKIINKIDKTLRQEQIMLVFKHMLRLSPGGSTSDKIGVKFLLNFFLGEENTTTLARSEVESLIADIKCYISINAISVREVIINAGLKIQEDIEYEAAHLVLTRLYPGMTRDKTYNIFRQLDEHRNGRFPLEVLFHTFNQNKQEVEKLYNSLIERVVSSGVSLRELLLELGLVAEFESPDVTLTDEQFRLLVKTIDAKVRNEQIELMILHLQQADERKIPLSKLLNDMEPGFKRSIREILDKLGQRMRELDPFIIFTFTREYRPSKYLEFKEFSKLVGLYDIKYRVGQLKLIYLELGGDLNFKEQEPKDLRDSKQRKLQVLQEAQLPQEGQAPQEGQESQQPQESQDSKNNQEVQKKTSRPHRVHQNEDQDQEDEVDREDPELKENREQQEHQELQVRREPLELPDAHGDHGDEAASELGRFLKEQGISESLDERDSPEPRVTITIGTLINTFQLEGDLALRAEEMANEVKEIVAQSGISLPELFVKFSLLDVFTGEISLEQFESLLQELDTSLNKIKISVIASKLMSPDTCTIKNIEFMRFFGYRGDEVPNILAKLKKKVFSENISIIGVLSLMRIDYFGSMSEEDVVEMLKTIDKTLRREEILLIYHVYLRKESPLIENIRTEDFVRLLCPVVDYNSFIVADVIEDLNMIIETKQNANFLTDLLYELRIDPVYEFGLPSFAQIIQNISDRISNDKINLLFQYIDKKGRGKILISHFTDVLTKDPRHLENIIEVVKIRLAENCLSLPELLVNMGINKNDKVPFSIFFRIIKRIDTGFTKKQIKYLFFRITENNEGLILIDDFLRHIDLNYQTVLSSYRDSCLSLLKSNISILSDVVEEFKLDSRSVVDWSIFEYILERCSQTLRKEEKKLMFLSLISKKNGVVVGELFKFCGYSYEKDVSQILEEVKRCFAKKNITVSKFLHLQDFDIFGNLSLLDFHAAVKYLDVSLRPEQISRISREYCKFGKISTRNFLTILGREPDYLRETTDHLRRKLLTNSGVSLMKVLIWKKIEPIRELGELEFERIMKVMEKRIDPETVVMFFQALQAFSPNGKTFVRDLLNFFYQDLIQNTEGQTQSSDEILRSLQARVVYDGISVANLFKRLGLRLGSDLDFLAFEKLVTFIDPTLDHFRIFSLFRKFDRYSNWQVQAQHLYNVLSFTTKKPQLSSVSQSYQCPEGEGALIEDNLWTHIEQHIAINSNCEGYFDLKQDIFWQEGFETRYPQLPRSNSESKVKLQATAISMKAFRDVFADPSREVLIDPVRPDLNSIFFSFDI